MAASGYVCPLGAIMELEVIKSILKNDEHRACVNTCGASNLSKVFLRLARKEGIDVINIVHREE